MTKTGSSEPKVLPICSKQYWRTALSLVKDTRMLVFAALIIALRVAVKTLKLTTGTISFTFDCYVNSLGSIVYGPIMGLLVGAVSDTLGCILVPSPTSPYFFPFIFVEMSSSFIFALFLWKRPLSPSRTLLCKFTVNMFCNVILTSLFIKWSYSYFGMDKVYNLFNLQRLVKNMITFPVESMLIVLILQAAIPVLQRCGLKSILPVKNRLQKKHYWLIALLLVISVGLILLYIFVLNDLLKANNIKLL